MQALIAAVVCGILSGARGCTAIADWIRLQPPEFWHALGFLRKPPTKNCYRNALLSIEAERLEQILATWLEQLFPEGLTSLQAVAVDGKTLCNTLQKHGRSIHLLALMDHATGGVIRQMQMPPETNEHKAALALLTSIVLKGKVITGDAMFCQRDLCKQIVDSGGDYYLRVKDNQPELKAAIEAEFHSAFSPLQRASTSGTTHAA